MSVVRALALEAARRRARAALMTLCSAGCIIGCAARASGPADAGPVPECETTMLGARCNFDGWSTECEVPCALPSDCSYRITVRWLGNYCGPAESAFDDCRCLDGRSLCRSYSTRPREVPTNYSEGWCPDAGSASDRDAGSFGVDASSVSAADASTDSAVDASL